MKLKKKSSLTPHPSHDDEAAALPNVRSPTFAATVKSALPNVPKTLPNVRRNGQKSLPNVPKTLPNVLRNGQTSLPNVRRNGHLTNTT